MSSVFVKLSPGGAVTWKPAAATSGDLPTEGNAPGDVRAVIDTSELYIWDGSTWNLASGGGGGGTPGGSSGTIQFNSSGTFAGDSQLQWDNTGKILNLNGLAIHALSGTVSLVDNQVTPVTAFSYSATSYNFTVIEYSLTRNTSKQVGILFIANDGSDASISNAFANLADIGVDFTVTVSGGNVNVQYTTTSTGFNAFLRYAMRQWI